MALQNFDFLWVFLYHFLLITIETIRRFEITLPTIPTITSQRTYSHIQMQLLFEYNAFIINSWGFSAY